MPVLGRAGADRARAAASASRVPAGREPRPDRALAGDRRAAGRAPHAEPARAVVVDAEDPPAVAVAPGGRMRLRGRLRLRGCELPRSGKRVELQAFDARPLARLRDDARVRPARDAGARATGSAPRAGSYRIRVRIPYEGTRRRSTAATRARSPCGWADARRMSPRAPMGSIRRHSCSPRRALRSADAVVLDDRGEARARVARVEGGGSLAGGGRARPGRPGPPRARPRRRPRRRARRAGRRRA